MADADRPSQKISVGRLYQIAFGWLGMSRTEFETMTFFEFNCRLEGWREIQEKERQEEWNRTRVLIDGIFRTVQWKGGKTPNVWDCYPMPWDKETRVPPKLTEFEQVERRYKFLKNNPGVKFTPGKMAQIEKHIEELRAKHGPLN